MNFEAIVIGVSAGGFKALEKLVTGLSSNIIIPIIIVQHISPNAENYIIDYLNERTDFEIVEVEEKDKISGKIYFAPPNYHVLIERNKTFSLTVDNKVNYSRPSIDVMFDSAAEAYMERLLGIVLTGANSDGKEGCERIKYFDGTVYVQDPDEAEFQDMPRSVIQSGYYDKILTIDELIKEINKINESLEGEEIGQ